MLVKNYSKFKKLSSKKIWHFHAEGNKKVILPVWHNLKLGTEKAYIFWMHWFILFHNKRHPIDMAQAKIEQYLTSLALDRNVAASTQNQAFNAILFLFRDVLGIDLDEIDSFRADERDRLPVVCSKEECMLIISHIRGISRLICKILYGSGLRLKECLWLRVQDIGFAMNQIVVRNGKGSKENTGIWL